MELKLELTVEEINLILSGLSELPFKVSNMLIFKIKSKAEAQMAKDNAEGVKPNEA